MKNSPIEQQELFEEKAHILFANRIAKKLPETISFSGFTEDSNGSLNPTFKRSADTTHRAALNLLSDIATSNGAKKVGYNGSSNDFHVFQHARRG